MKYALLLSAVLVTASAHAQTANKMFLSVGNSESVVLLSDEAGTISGTGVNLTADGTFLTVRHVADLLPTAYATFRDGRTVEVRPTWKTDKYDGPAIMRAVKKIGPLPYSEIGSGPPDGTVYTIGYPNRRFTATEGQFLDSVFMYDRGDSLVTTAPTDSRAIQLNRIAFDTEPGASGSPVFNAEDKIVGLVVATDNSVSFAATYKSLEHPKALVAEYVSKYPQDALAQQAAPRVPQPQTKPVLVVIGASYCGPCIQFKNRLAHDESFSKEVYARCEYVHLDISNPLEVPRAVQYGFRMGIDEVPTFLLIHNRTLIGKMVGYGDPDEFLAWLDSNTQKIVGQAAPQQPPTQTPQEPVVVDGGDSDPVADLIENGDEFTGVTIVLLIAEQVKAEEGTLKDKVLGYTAAAWERLLRDVFSKHDVAIASISERADPERYALACQTFGVDPEKGYLLVGVPKTNQGFSKGLMVKMIESKIGAKVETYGAPVDVIFERSDRVHYQQLLDIVAMVPQTSSPYDLSWKGWLPYLVTSGLVALCGERVMVYLMFISDMLGIIFQSPITWVKNRRSPTQDASVPPSTSTPQGKPDDGIVIE